MPSPPEQSAVTGPSDRRDRLLPCAPRTALAPGGRDGIHQAQPPRRGDGLQLTVDPELAQHALHVTPSSVDADDQLGRDDRWAAPFSQQVEDLQLSSGQ